MSISSIGLLLGRLLGVNEYDLAAVPFPQTFDPPIIETADFEDCHKLRVHLGELLKERLDLFRASTHLAA